MGREPEDSARGGEERRHQGDRVKLTEQSVVLQVQEQSGHWSLNLMWQGPGAGFCSYSSQPGSPSLSARGNGLVCFSATYIQVSMGQSWLRTACSKKQEEKSLPISYQLPLPPPKLAHPSLGLLRKDSRNQQRTLVLLHICAQSTQSTKVEPCWSRQPSDMLFTES